MKYLVINSHPYEKSFNYTLCEEMFNKLKNNGKDVTLINLVKDGFNPAMSGNDLYNWRKGVAGDELTENYIKLVQEADVLIFSFPIWWGNLPAILKGFCDKVFLPNVAYSYDEQHNMVPKLTGKKAVVITTMELENTVFDNYFNNPVKNAFINVTLNTVGIETIKHFQFEKISSSGKDYTTQKFNEVLSYIETL